MPQRKVPTLDALQKATSIGADPQGEALSQMLSQPVHQSAVPLDPTMLESLGKPLSELLGAILSPTTPGTGLPSRLRIGNVLQGGKALLYGTRKGGEQFEALPSELDSMINSGQLGLEQPPQRAVDVVRRKLAALLDAAPAAK